jgi:hypothetical protein
MMMIMMMMMLTKISYIDAVRGFAAFRLENWHTLSV